MNYRVCQFVRSLQSAFQYNRRNIVAQKYVKIIHPKFELSLDNPLWNMLNNPDSRNIYTLSERPTFAACHEQTLFL